MRLTDRELANYALFNDSETELLGCVYIDPPGSGTQPDRDALASWWVVDRMHGTDLERAIDEFVPRWLSETWASEKLSSDARP